jgi:ketosteroid isomerase-like protein
MPLLFRTSAIVVILAVTSWSVAQEPLQPTLTPRIITATRQVSLFSGMEKELLNNVQAKNQVAIESMLADDCQIYQPDADPLGGPDWIDSVMAKDFRLKSFMIRQVSVIDLGDSALVNYTRVQEATYKSKPENGEFFVVDLWKKDSGSWKLASRYVSKISATATMPKGPIRPTGKQ